MSAKDIYIHLTEGRLKLMKIIVALSIIIMISGLFGVIYFAVKSGDLNQQYQDLYEEYEDLNDDYEDLLEIINSIPKPSGINLRIDEEFSVNLWNDTTNEYDIENSQNYSVLFALIQIQKYDSRLLDAYRRNATGESLYEILGNETNIVAESDNIFIGNGITHAFMLELSEIIFDDEPTPENFTEILLPLTNDVISMNISSPFLISGISLFCIKKNTTDLELFTDDVFIFGTGFVENTTIFNPNPEMLIESPFLIEENQYANLTINSVTMNMTDDLWYSSNSTIKLEQDIFNIEYNAIPMNPFAIMMLLITIFNEL